MSPRGARENRRRHLRAQYFLNELGGDSQDVATDLQICGPQGRRVRCIVEKCGDRRAVGLRKFQHDDLFVRRGVRITAEPYGPVQKLLASI